jgi:glycosyl hydrolase family 38
MTFTSSYLSVVFLTLASAAAGAEASEIETIYVVPFTHNDVGFDATPMQMAANSVQSIDDAIELAAADPQYVWNIETFWQLRHWLDAGRNPEPLLKLLRDGRFGLNAAFICPHTSVMKAWMLDQLFRVPVDWSRKHDLVLDWAMINDVPGHPPGLPRFLADNGVKYLALGTNQSLSKKLPDEVSNTPFWWETLDGKHRVLTFICAESYTGAYMKYGIDPQTSHFFTRKNKEYPSNEPLDIMKQNMGEMLEEYRKKEYPFDAVMAMHAFDNWGAGNSKKLPGAAELWNEKVGKPRIVVSTPREFFRHIEEKYADDLPVRRGGFGGQWDNMRCWIPTAMRAAYAQEKLLMAKQDPDVHAIGRLLAFYGHTIGAGPCWPGHLTREITVEHNLQFLELQADWPREKIQWPVGKPVELPADSEGEKYGRNQLYMARVESGTITHEPMPESSWLMHRAERLDDGTLRLRHRIDRRKLPPERVYVMWSWHLTEDEAKAPVTVRGAAAPWIWREDALAGYSINGWIAPDEFRLGDTVFRPHGPLWFGKLPGRPEILYSSVLRQLRKGHFKDIGEDTLTFDEACPGEDPIYEFAIDIITDPHR